MSLFSSIPDRIVVEFPEEKVIVYRQRVLGGAVVVIVFFFGVMAVIL